MKLAPPRRAAPLGLALIALGLIAPGAWAHDQSFSYANLDWARDRIAVQLSAHRDDAAAALELAEPESLMRAPYLARHAGPLARVLLAGLRIQGDGKDLALRLEGATAEPERRTVELKLGVALVRPVAHLRVAAKLLPWNPQHETFLNVYAGGRLVRQAVLTAADPAADLYGEGGAGVLAVVWTFVAAGIHHIFIGPDHILFMVGLLLLGGGLARLIKVVTTFTVAHSITLALAVLGLLSVPGRIVEPLIALSIVYVGFENLRTQPGRRDWRTRIAFGFGLVHGLGFASVLRELGLPREALGWSLLAFNLGVEIGQACIVLAVAPLLAGLRAGPPRVARRAIAAGAWGIIFAGGYWLVQRVAAAG